MKVAIVGSSGYISSFLIKRIKTDFPSAEILKIDQSGDYDLFVDLNNPNNFDFDKLQGVDYIIFTAAISGPDKCANDFEYCWNVNVVGTKWFIENSIKRKCKILFFSSDAVFGEDLGSAFNENSPTNANTPYGRMKKEVEDSFKNDKFFKAIRLSYVASKKDRFTSYCLSCIENNINAEIFHPFYRNVIVISDVLDAVKWLITNWDEYECAFLNIAGKELVSRVRMADEINRVFRNSLNYSINTPDSTFFLNRPKITQMESLYLYNKRIISDKSFTLKYLKELKEN